LTELLFQLVRISCKRNSNPNISRANIGKVNKAYFITYLDPDKPCANNKLRPWGYEIGPFRRMFSSFENAGNPIGFGEQSRVNDRKAKTGPKPEI